MTRVHAAALPTWRVRSTFMRQAEADVWERHDAAVSLEAALGSTGGVWHPWVTFAPRAVHVSVLVKAESKPEAALHALESIDAVRRLVDCSLVGDLVRQTIEPSVHPWREGV